MRIFYNKINGFSNNNWHELRSIESENFMMKKKYSSYPLIFTTKYMDIVKLYIVTQLDISDKHSGHTRFCVQM